MQDHVLRAGLRTVTSECGCQGISAVLTLPIERRGRGALISDPVSSKATWNQDHDHVKKRFRGTVVATNEGLVCVSVFDYWYRYLVINRFLYVFCCVKPKFKTPEPLPGWINEELKTGW